MADYKKYLKPEVLAKITRLEMRARMVVEGFISGMHKSPYQGFSVEFAAHREYVPGDDRRFIHWKSTARSGTLQVREFLQTRRSLVAVVLAGDPADSAEPAGHLLQ